MIRTHVWKDGKTHTYLVRVNGRSYGTFSERDHGSKKAAKAAARLAEANAVTGKATVRRYTVTQYAARFLQRMADEPMKSGRTRKSSTMDTLAASLRPFCATYGTRRLTSFTRSEAIDVRGAFRPNTVKAVVQMFEAALDEELVERNPFKGLSPTTRGRRDEHPPTREEFNRLVAACSVHDNPRDEFQYGTMMRALLVFAAHSGMRPGELFALRWEDVDFDRMRVNVGARVYRGSTDLPKSNKPREIVLMAPARDALLPLPRVSEYVFVGKRGQRLSAPTLSTLWAPVKAKAGVDKAWYLVTKHYCVHYLYFERRVSKNAVAQQMGWSEKTVDDMLAIYGHGDAADWQGELEDRDNVRELGAAKRG